MHAVVLSYDFTLRFLSSCIHVLSILLKLKPSEIVPMNKAFIKNETPRFLKYFKMHQPYGPVPEYIRKEKKQT
jgi:hypothetical protein